MAKHNPHNIVAPLMPKPRPRPRPRPRPKPRPKPPQAPGHVAPAAPAAPVGQPFAPDSLYYSETDLADRAAASGNTDLNAQEAAVQFDYGLDDPTNPNSRAAALKRAYLARSNADVTTAGNHLYAGSMQRRIERTRRDQEFATADLRQGLESALAGIRRQRGDLGFDTEQSKAQSYRDAIDRAPAAVGPAAAPAAPGAPVAPGVPARTAPRPVSARNPQQQAFRSSRTRTNVANRRAVAVAKAKVRQPRNHR